MNATSIQPKSSHLNAPSTDDKITQIQCPHCSMTFDLSDGVLSHLRNTIRDEQSQQQSVAEKALREKERALGDRTRELDARQSEIEDQVKARLAAQMKAVEEKARAEAKDTVALQMSELTQALEERNAKLKHAQEHELALRKRERELEDRQREQELEIARQLDIERKKILEATTKRVGEENHLKLAEKEKLISDLSRKIEDLKRQAEQGSIQAQGETLEVCVEEMLRTQFPLDEIVPVAKGVCGADITQHVGSRTGRQLGTIVFETKRTRNWSAAWIPKFRADQLSCGADIAVLVTEVLPKEVERFGFVDGVWVCDYAAVVALVTTLRWSLQQVSLVKLSDQNRADKAHVLYSYVTGQEFRQRVEAILSCFSTMREDLESEKRSILRQWAKREKQHASIQQNVAEMFGAFEGIAGNELPPTNSLLLVS